MKPMNEEMKKVLQDEIQKQGELIHSLLPMKGNAAHTAYYGKLFDSLIDTQDAKSYDFVLSLLQGVNEGSMEITKDIVDETFKFTQNLPN